MDSFIDKFSQRKNAQEMIRANAMAEAEEKERMVSKLSEYELAMQEMRRCNLQTIENAEKVKELLTVGLNKIEEVQKKDVDFKLEKLVGEIRQLSEDLKNRDTGILEGLKSRESGIREELKNRNVEFLEEQKSQSEEYLKEQKIELERLLDKQNDLLEKQNTQMQDMLDAVEELVHGSEDFMHKESVKVYRNVQAVIEGTLPKQTEQITEAMNNALEEKESFGGFKVVWILTLVAALANVTIEVLKFLGYM